jgi:site-specific DNA-methyltransferase (adenine-specific)
MTLLLPAPAAPLALAAPRYTDSVWCMDALALLVCLPDASVDMVLTSPPYDNLRTYKGYSWDFEGIARETYRVLKPGGVLVWVVGDSVVDGSETLSSFRQALYFQSIGFRVHDTMIWHKDGAPFPESNRYLQTFEYMFVFSKGTPKSHHALVEKTKYGASRTSSGRDADGSISRFKYELKKPERKLDNVWYVPSGYMKTTKDIDAFQHPAMFPEELARRHIATWSNPGDTVLDFFMGSGTTAKMARALGRHYIGCDISAEYVQLCNERLAIPFTLPLFTDTPAPARATQEALPL